jgi:putative SOS response-associated peptidase YedK
MILCLHVRPVPEHASLSRGRASVQGDFGRHGARVVVRWNIVPSQPIRAVRVGEDGAGGRELVALRWGFVPSWSKAPDDGPRPINACADAGQYAL